MEIITGYTGKPHVTSEQDRDVNIGVVGEGSYVLQTGMQLAAEVSSNNEIKIRDGVLMHQGCTASIKKNTYDSLTIINGSQGMKRIDLIVARYEKNQDNRTEGLDLKVIQGTPAESNPVVPEYTEGDIQAGDYVADMPMYQVIIDGLNITEVKKVFEVAPGIDAMKKEIAELNSNKKVECFSKTVASETNILVDFSSEVNQIIKNGGKIISAIPGATTNSNNALVYGKVAIQALSDWSEVYVRCNSNYYSGLGGTTTLNLLVIYV
ncbi:hypothetical protein I2700191B6_18650 [Dorea formicigenerans]|uniref:hypothetical protein n=1 Tax=Dorea formicigenerans TaxID=39486 RepID=UPI0036F34E4C